MRGHAGHGRTGVDRRRRTRSFAGVLLLVLFGEWQAVADSGQLHAQEDAVYGYIDDHGQMRHVQSLDEIPPRLRPYAQRIDRPSEDSSAQASVLTLLETKVKSGDKPVVYRYVTPRGMVRYTNLLSSVPPLQRSAAAVDLSRVSLNSDVGRDLNGLMEVEHARLAKGPACQQLRAAAEKPLWREVWEEHRALAIFGALALLLVIVTPGMMERFGAEWGRTLAKLLPLVAGFGLIGYAAVRGAQSLSAFKGKAAPCEQGTWDAAGKSEGGVVERLQVLQTMHAQQHDKLEQIAAESR